MTVPNLIEIDIENTKNHDLETDFIAMFDSSQKDFLISNERRFILL
jgi:hypothetical protein